MNAPNFVGRQSDLNHIEEQFLHVMTAQPRVLLIGGVAGMGKTRLVEQIETMAALHEMRIAVGQCHADMAQPYVPFLSLLSYFEEEDLRDDSGRSFLHVLSGAATASSGVSTALDAKPAELLFMNVTQAVLTLASRGPLLLMIEDLHWADPSTLDLFAYLAFALAEQASVPLLLIGTYRPVDAETRLGHLLERLEPEQVTRSWVLSGLDETETRHFLRELGVRRPTQQLVQTVHGATQGIPLFIQEAVYHLTRQGALYEQSGYLSVRTGALPSIELPRTLSNAIADRLRSLPATCQFPLTLAALLGETFETDVLQMLVALSPQALQEALAAGVGHRVLLREAAHFRFAHPLLRHAFYNRLAPVGRRQYHLQIAQTLETRYADDLEPHVLEIAYHLVQAGSLAEPQTVMAYARRAGERAFAMYAWYDAARYYEAALTASELVSTLPAQDRADLLYQAGVSHYRNQDIEPAQVYFERAAEGYREIGDVRGLAHALAWLTNMSFMHTSLPMDVMANLQPLHEVLDALGDTDPGLSGYVMVIIAQAYRVTRQSDRADEFAQQALELGQRANNDIVCSAALNALGLAHLGRLHVETAIQSWQESIRHARHIDNLFQYSLPLLNIPLALNLKGMLEEAEIQSLEAGEVSRLIQDWSGYSKALSHLASVSVAKGNFTDAEEQSRQTMQMIERSHYTWSGFRSLQALSCSFALRGLWNEANNTLDIIIEPGRLFAAPGRFETLLVRTFRQLILTYKTETFDENIAILSSELVEVVQDDTYSIAPLCAIIELGVATFNPTIIGQPAMMLADAMQRGVFVSSGWAFLLPRILGLVAVMRREWEQAEEHFQHALSLGATIGTRPELARTYYDYARMMLLRKERGVDYRRALGYLESASTMLHELNMLPHAQAVSRLKQAIAGSVST